MGASRRRERKRLDSSTPVLCGKNGESDAAKSENLLFAGSVSKKGQAKLALFWVKARKTHYYPPVRP
jgi:hypothetical protein